ncbi:LysR substrate-binding domain-containing protein [Paucibacter sp. JuS9]|uniref:LysR family transcriptional regulator n=1 Tax=Paucibacter sp. JuS9 TaxID=3228748 RepID=UPI00375647A8
MTTTSSTDRLSLMATFVRIVEAGSLSAAALQLGTTQPTVSRRLKALEESLGLQLLQRSTQALRLTEGGAQCYEQARVLLADWDAMEASLRGAQEEPEGMLRVLVPHALGQLQLMQPLIDLLRRAPKLNVEWLLDDQPPKFSAQDLDCAIRVGALADTSVVALKLAEIPRIVVSAPSLLEGRAPPQAPADLNSFDWLALGTFYRNELTLHGPAGQHARLALRPRLITDSLFALRNAVAAGLGVAAMSAWLAHDDLAAGRLVQLLPQWRAPALPVHLVYPYQRHQPAKLRLFVAAMRDSLSSLAHSATGLKLAP